MLARWFKGHEVLADFSRLRAIAEVFSPRNGKVRLGLWTGVNHRRSPGNRLTSQQQNKTFQAQHLPCSLLLHLLPMPRAPKQRITTTIALFFFPSIWLFLKLNLYAHSQLLRWKPKSFTARCPCWRCPGALALSSSAPRANFSDGGLKG